MAVLESASFLDPSDLPTDASLLPGYVNASFEEVAQHFDASKVPGGVRGVDVQAAVAEWKSFKPGFRRITDKVLKDCPTITVAAGKGKTKKVPLPHHMLFKLVWAAVLKSCQAEFSNICKLAENIMVCPFSSVECERGFSVQNLIKSKLRNRLTADTLDMLMRVRLCAPRAFAQFDAAAAIAKWKDMRQYRHMFSVRKPRHWHLLAVAKNAKQQEVYVISDSVTPTDTC